MRIIAVSDLHGSLERLELLLEITKADLYLFTGDLLYNPFYSLSDLEAFYTVQMAVRSWRYQDNPLSNISVPLWLRSKMPGFSQEQKAIAEQYLDLSVKARKDMQRKYRSLERLRRIKPSVPMYFVPGNYDMDLRGTALAQYQLHKQSAEVQNVRISGYGGAPVFTSGVPEHLAVNFHETKNASPNGYSEVLNSLLHHDPHIAALHVPPLGIRDGSPNRSFGSWGVREFVEQSHNIRVLFCGHVHNGWGVSRLGKCWVVNSGNFGQVVEGTGYKSGGYFSEVTLDAAGNPQSAILKRLEQGKIWHLLEYTEQENGTFCEREIEPRRARERRLHPTISSTSRQQEKALPPDVQLLQNYNQIKLFLRRFETPASEQRVDDLREMISIAAKSQTIIAFDILGSVNVGQSTDESDVDAILYIEDDPANNRYNPTYWTDLVRSVTNDRYEMDFTDIIDLWEVRQAIKEHNADNEALQRFVIYRTVGRPVNVRLLRKYDDLLQQAGDLRQIIQSALRKDLEMMAGTYSQNKSLQKYLARVQDAGIVIPPRIQMRIHRYLHTIE